MGDSNDRTGKEASYKARAQHEQGYSVISKWTWGTSLVVQRLRIRLLMQGTRGLIPGQGTKIPPVAEQLGPRATTGEPVGCSSRVHERYKPWPAAREVRADPASQIKQRKKRKWTGISGILQALGQSLKKHNCYVRKEEKME